MDSLQITNGEKRIMINDDPTRVIVFNPSDVLFAEKFYRLIGEFQSKLTEYEAQAKMIEKVTDVDANNLPVNAEARIELIKSACQYIKERIDILFGVGTSQIVFGDALNLDMFMEFFTNITPFIQTARASKVQKYINTAVRKSKKR